LSALELPDLSMMIPRENHLSMGIERLLLQGNEEAAKKALESLEQIRTQVDQGPAP